MDFYITVHDMQFSAFDSLQTFFSKRNDVEIVAVHDVSVQSRWTEAFVGMCEYLEAGPMLFLVRGRNNPMGARLYLQAALDEHDHATD